MSLDPATRASLLAEFLAEPPPRHRVPAVLRKAAMRDAASGFLFFFGTAFTAFGIFFMWAFIPWKFRQDLQLRDGATATGQVVVVEKTGVSINDTHVMRYEFKFQPGNGGETRGECFTTGTMWSEGESVTIRYLPDNPTISIIEGARRSTGNLASLFVLLFPLVGAAVLAWAVAARRRMKALLEHGRVTEALVTKIDETSVSINRQFVHAITLQCTDGAALVARHYKPEIVAFAEERLATQQPVYVVYDPAHPKRVLLPETLI